MFVAILYLFFTAGGQISVGTWKIADFHHIKSIDREKAGMSQEVVDNEK